MWAIQKTHHWKIKNIRFNIKEQIQIRMSKKIWLELGFNIENGLPFQLCMIRGIRKNLLASIL